MSDQLGEVLGRALSPGVNDPQTAVLCLNWLRAGLVVFAGRAPARQSRRGDPVLYRRVRFEDMLDRSFDEMRQYVATDRTVTLHALKVLSDIAINASCDSMVDACIKQMLALTASAQELLPESIARDEEAAGMNRVRRDFAAHQAAQPGQGDQPAVPSTAGFTIRPP